MKYVVAVHLGTLHSSARGQVDRAQIENCIAGIMADIAGADGLVVIDGMLSDAIPQSLNLIIAEKLTACAARGQLAARIWGCDDGGAPYAAWHEIARDAGFGHRFISQEAAAEAAVSSLSAAADILVTGAWASQDNASGCASSVYTVLRADLPPDVLVRISEECLFEEYIDDPDDPEEAEPDGGVCL